MRDYGRVYSAFWTSADMQSLSDDGRLLALYLLSGPHTTIAGVCRLPDGYVCEDLKWTSARVDKGFTELLAKGFANRCGTTKWVWIRKFLTWNKPENPNQWKAARKIAATVPSNCCWSAVFQRVFSVTAGDIPDDPENPCATLIQGLPEPLPTQEQDQKQDQEQKQEQDCAKKFAPDTVAGLDLDAWQQWVDYRAKRKPAIKAVSMQAAAEELAKYGADQQAVVKQSIAGGYQGLFPLKGSPPVKPPTRRAKTAAELEAEEAAREQR